MCCPPADPDAHHDFSLSRRLNVTRGSFYHHFRNREDFVRTLLAAWEEDYTERMLAYTAQGRSAGETLTRYLSIAAEKQPGREVSIRAWSLHDPLVGEFQQRVDTRRLDFAIRTCRRLVHMPGQAEVTDRDRVGGLRWPPAIPVKDWSSSPPSSQPVRLIPCDYSLL
jgi:AcrR family transcriptional regulator